MLAESMGSRTGWPSPGEPCRRRRGNLYLSDPGAIGGHGDFEQEGDLIECSLKESLLSCLYFIQTTLDMGSNTDDLDFIMG